MFLPTQIPFKILNPGMHTQMNDPGVFWQVEKAGQLCVPCVHSSMSTWKERMGILSTKI